jgi:putative ABC transport system permease protein
VLKGNFARGKKNAAMRSTLVVFQFATSVILIISTVVIYRQMSFILNAKLGYDKEQVLIIQGTRTLGDQTNTFKEELLNLSAVKSVTISDYLPVSGMKRNGNGFWNEGKQKIDASVGGQFWRVDPDYATTLGLKVVDGRFFDRKMASDSDAIVINQRMAKDLNLTEPIGKKIINYRNWNVIGVVENFHFSSLRTNIGPLAMVLGNSNNAIAVKLNTEDIQSTITEVGNVWRQFSPHQPIRLAFLDESFERMYDDIRRMGNVFTSFAILAIVVACLGLFALSAFMVEQRGKEISIRLVLGASVRSVFGLLTFNFVKLVVISIVIAAPVAWYIMDKWLASFEYQTTIGWDVFVVAGGMALLIALSTISYQSIKAGLVKPVNNLRAE